jgi:tetratricopeptide (TPR) repeat protein
MFRHLRATARGLLYPLRQARRRPWSAAGAALVAAAAVTGGGWARARHQWQAARAALAADRPQEARARLALPLAVWRWDPEVQVLAARAARMSGDLPAAEAHLKRSLRLAGGATEAAQLEFLLLRVQTGETDRVAAPLLEAADRGHPDAPLILSTLAVSYMNNLRYGRAFACLSRWIELRPDAAKAYQFRGWVLERMGRRKEALADYHKALEIDADLLAARLRLAEMLLEDHQPQLALPHLERLYRQAPDDALVQARLGMCRLHRGEARAARPLMEAAADRLPNDPALQVNLARLDLQEGRAAEAERRLRAVIRKDPSDSEALFTLFSAVKAQGRADEAREVLAECERAKAALGRTHKLLREVVEGPSATPADFAELGELLLGMNQEDRALYWLYKALERDPDHQRSHRVLADHYERKGDAGRAASHRYRVRQR